MSKEWRDAWWLAKFEFKQTKLNVSLILLGIILFAFVFSMNLWELRKDTFTVVFIDWLFVSAVILAPLMGRTKNFALTRVYGDFWGSLYFNYLKQTAISEKTLVRSRFIIFGCQSLVLNVILFVIIYFASESFQNQLSSGSFVLFSLLWIIIGLAVSLSFAASEVGSEVPSWKMILYCVLFYGGIIAIAIWYYSAAEWGMLGGTILLIEQFPFWTMMSAVILLIISCYYWNRYAVKMMHKNNYL